MQWTAFFISSYLLMVVVGFSPLIGAVEQRAICPEDYSPCSCDDTTEGLSVSCAQVPISQVQVLFRRTTARDLSSFQLTIAPSETSSIPADLLGSSRASKVSIICSGSLYKLVIDDNAFSTSKLFTKQFIINGCDLNQQPNFGFLNGFEALTSLDVSNSKNFKSLQGIPSQGQLYYVSIRSSRGFENLDDGYKIALPSLRIFWLFDNELNDVTAAKLLKCLATSSTESLEELRLNDNKLTFVPELIPSFSKLLELLLERNTISSLHTRSLAFFGRIGYINLGNNGISSIEPSAFGGGSFKFVYMYLNKLTRLDSYTFQTMLEAMIQNGGYLTLPQNPIECDCHLAWLIVHKRYLLPAIDSGTCSNSTKFEDLNPLGLRDCPAFTCPVNINGNFPDPLSCSSYYVCLAGMSTFFSCPAGLVFNPAYQVCDWPYNVPNCK